MVQAGTVDRGGPSVVLRCAQNADGIGGRSLILAGVALDLGVNPTALAQNAGQKHEDQQEKSAQDPVAALRLEIASHAHHLTVVTS